MDIEQLKILRNNILKKVSDRIVKEVPLNKVFNLLVGELKQGKSLYKTYKQPKNIKYVESPCCGSDGFTIHKNTNLYKCYSCGTSGSSITLVRMIFNCTKHTAVNWLIERFKIDVKDIVDDYTKMYSLDVFKNWIRFKEELEKDDSPLPF